MRPTIDTGPGAERHRLAVVFAERACRSVERPEIRDMFARMRGTVAFVAQDVGTSITLRFDFGRLTLHDGIVGVPDVTFLGAEADIEELGNARVLPVVPVPLPGRLRVYGLALHPRLVSRVVRLLAPGPPLTPGARPG